MKLCFYKDDKIFGRARFIHINGSYIDLEGEDYLEFLCSDDQVEQMQSGVKLDKPIDLRKILPKPANCKLRAVDESDIYLYEGQVVRDQPHGKGKVTWEK